jgi:hypothetical protein
MSQTKPDPDAGDFQELPRVPVWAVGADAQHGGPSGMGPGTDRPGLGPDDEEAEKVEGSGRNDEVKA